MKCKLGLFFLLFPVFAMAQTKVSKDSLAKITLNDLKESWTLGIDTASDVVDIKVYNKFKSLFTDSAKIDNDLDAFYRYDAKKMSDRYNGGTAGQAKAFDEYAHDIALKLKSLIIDSIVVTPSQINDQKTFKFSVRRNVRFEKPGKYVLPDDYAAMVIGSRKISFEQTIDSLAMVANLKSRISANADALYKFNAKNILEISMVYESDSVRISGIKNVFNEILCTNDFDGDGVLDVEDSAKTVFGDFTANGRSDFDLDGVPDDNLKGVQEDKDKCKDTYGVLNNRGCPFSYFLTKQGFEVFIGMQLNSAEIILPELNQLGYRDAAGNDAMDILQSRKGRLSSPGLVPGAHGGGNYTYYFGVKRKRAGISIGVTYGAFTADYQLTDPEKYTFKSLDALGNAYRRQVTIDSLSEAINYSIFNFPVMFNYRFYLDKKKHKSVINVRIGPSLMILNGTTNYNATIDFGGIYQIDTTGRNVTAYYDYFNEASKSNVYFTSSKINAQSPSPGATNVFEQLKSKNYDFAYNKAYVSKQHVKRLAVAFNLDLDMQYKISEGLTLKAGPHLSYAPLFERKNKYKPIDRTTDDYQSVYNSNGKTAYTAFGINLGFVYNF